MKNSITVTSVFFLLLTIGCSDSKKEEPSIEENKVSNQMAHGFKLLESNCFSCHSANSSQESGVAPSMKKVKLAYLENNITLEQFSNSLINAVQNPSVENSKMPDAIQQFGLMPKMNFTKAQLNDIATYLYNTNIEKENWYDDYYLEEHQKHTSANTKPISPTEQGLEYALKTKSILGKNLLGVIKSKGTVGALLFCNENAIHLTDTVANQIKGVEVKRVSDKNRNPANKANVNELSYIEKAKTKLIYGEKITPQIQEIDGQIVGYYPITTNNMCMQCHGDLNSDIEPNTYTKIKELYPDDLAVGYSVDELRGIWVVTMPK